MAFFHDIIFQPRINFRYGRKDCPTSPLNPVSREGSFPGGHFNHSMVMDFFRTEFGLDPRGATALLGAHTLGGASGGSGFSGLWKEGRKLMGL